MGEVLLGINIDHAATIRQARATAYPNMTDIAKEALSGGGDFITVHLREDRRHIQDSDLPPLAALDANLNLEIAAVGEMQQTALALRPRCVCIVPERRAELTTEGGLDVCASAESLRAFCLPLLDAGIEVSLFVDADNAQIEAAAKTGAAAVELHTGDFAADGDILPLTKAAQHAASLGLKVNAGHGLHSQNAAEVAAIPQIAELNIGHAVIARALFVGIRTAVAEVAAVVKKARR